MSACLRRCLAVVLALCLHATSWSATPWVSGFYVGWQAQSYPPSAVDYGSLTHVMMFSVLPRADGTLDTSFFGAGPAVAVDLAQRAHAAGRKAVLVVGGAGMQAQFQGAASAANIDRFAQNIAAAVRQYGYDGVDLDWEPIASTDQPMVLSLVSKLRAALPAGSLITADVGWVNANFPLSSAEAAFYSQLASQLDQMNIMTYGMADAWGGWQSWHSSALQGAAGNTPSSVESSVNAYAAAGVPLARLGMGIGFYGSCWISPVTGPRQPPSGSSVVASDNEFGYANLMAQYHSGAAYRYDTTAQAPYLSFTGPTGARGCTFISFEDATSVAAKGQYARSRGLGGTIIWQLNEGHQPGAPNPNALLAAVGAAFLGGGGPAAATTTGLVAGPATTVFGQASTLTATVSSASGTPTGTVVFVEGAISLGSAPLSGGQASLALSSLAVGSHAVAARYAGSTGYAASASPATTLSVLPASTSTALTSSRNPTKPRTGTTFAAKVSVQAPGGGQPQGNVTFYDGGFALGTVALGSTGSASFTTKALSRGTHAITATYSGSGNHRASTSPVLSQAVQ